MITEKDIDEKSMTGDLIHSIFFFIIHITVKNFFGTMYSSIHIGCFEHYFQCYDDCYFNIYSK